MTKRQEDNKTKRQQNKKTKLQKDKMTKRQKGEKTERKKDRKTKDKKQRPKREFYIVTSGQFRTLAMFSLPLPFEKSPSLWFSFSSPAFPTR